MSDKTPCYIDVDDLRIGHYVYVDVGWMHHPFTFSSFKITSNDEIVTLRSLGVSQFRYDPSRSDVKPDAKVEKDDTTKTIKSSPEPASENNPVLKEKQERISLAQRLRAKLIAVEKEYSKAGSVVRDIMKNLFSAPAQASASANKLVTEIADALAPKEDVAVYLMSDHSATGEEVYFHSLNVATLAMMVARSMQLDAAKIHTVGMGGLFHDIGKAEIPDKILLKTEPLNSHEEKLFRQHGALGVKAATHLKLSEDIKNIIAQHHECMDGYGYPVGLRGNEISIGARIVSVVNAYDSLCNPHDPASTVIPYKALSTMFAKQKDRFDSDVLMTLIRILGVYPPGTVVKLSNDMVGMVIGVNTSNPLRPQILVYDEGISHEESITLDLQRETNINISSAINPSQLSKAAIEYLNPRKRVKYFVDTTKALNS
ncbi:MAG: HD domain-containing phosphohydrolase [Pseudomonadota bacterium]